VVWATGLIVPVREPRPPIVEALAAEAENLRAQYAAGLFTKTE
jgi:hypothetical protein